MTPENLREKISSFLNYHINSSDMDSIMSLIDQSKGEQPDLLEKNKIYESGFMDGKNSMLKVAEDAIKNQTVNIVSGISYKGEVVRYEQLEVYIKSYTGGHSYWVNFLENTRPIKEFKSKQEALAYCAKYNLRVVGDD